MPAPLGVQADLTAVELVPCQEAVGDDDVARAPRRRNADVEVFHDHQALVELHVAEAAEDVHMVVAAAANLVAQVGLHAP